MAVAEDDNPIIEMSSPQEDDEDDECSVNERDVTFVKEDGVATVYKPGTLRWVLIKG